MHSLTLIRQIPDFGSSTERRTIFKTKKSKKSYLIEGKFPTDAKFNVEARHNELRISGSYPESDGSVNFQESFSWGKAFEISGIKATFESGCLKIVIPKLSKEKEWVSILINTDSP